MCLQEVQLQGVIVNVIKSKPQWTKKMNIIIVSYSNLFIKCFQKLL